jgi:integrase
MKLEQHEDGLYYVTFRTVAGTDETVCTNKDILESAQRVVADAKIEEIERASEARILSAQVMGRILVQKAPTLKVAFEEYLKWMREQSTYSHRTQRVYRNTIHDWCESVGLWNKQVSLVEPIDVAKFINYADTRKAITRSGVRSQISSFLTFCINQGYCFSNPAATVKVDHRILTHAQKEKRPTVLFTDAEVRSLLSKTTGFWHAAIALAFYAGLRISDILRLEWSCFQHPDQITFWTLKTNTRCTVPLTLPLQQALEHVIKSDEKYLFPGEYHAYCDDSSNLSHAFSDLCIAHGLGKRNFHALRHSYVTRSILRGVPNHIVSERVGHRSTATTEQYTHIEHGNNRG